MCESVLCSGVWVWVVYVCVKVWCTCGWCAGEVCVWVKKCTCSVKVSVMGGVRVCERVHMGGGE